jgi:hypothetical protein
MREGSVGTCGIEQEAAHLFASQPASHASMYLPLALTRPSARSRCCRWRSEAALSSEESFRCRSDSSPAAALACDRRTSRAKGSKSL